MIRIEGDDFRVSRNYLAASYRKRNHWFLHVNFDLVIESV